MPESTGLAPGRRIRGRALALITATAALLGSSVALAPAAFAAVGAVTIDAPSTAQQGDTVDVTIAVDTATDLFAYDLTVTYDPALLEYDDASADFPAGGFDAVAEGTGSVTFTHTRLGTSPGLAGAQSLVTFSFTALAGGSATITLSGAGFVDSTSTTTALAAPVSTSVTVTPAPVASPSPTTSSSPSASPSPSGSASPSPTASPSTSASPSGAASPSPSPSSSASAVAADDAEEASDDPLAATGSDAGGIIVAGAFAAVLVALGAVLVIRRRKEVVR